MHKSVPIGECEVIDITPINPLISRCQIKVCYVGDEPNRNRSVITKDVAKQLANSLPGCPIVGYYNEGNEDFEEHNRSIDISNGQWKFKDTTKPYGFVGENAKVWFRKYRDDDQVEHEYMCTEGYLWTGQYPECKRAVEKGNNQSMELDENHLSATWSNGDNGKPRFFIINEGIISKLCILGEECEPCFEGSNITKPEVKFSFEPSFMEEMRSMMTELKQLLKDEGGAQVFTRYEVEIGDSVWSALYAHIQNTENLANYSIEAVLEDSEVKFAVLKNEDKYMRLDFSISDGSEIQFANELVDVTETYTPASEPQFALADVEAFETEYKCGGSGSSAASDKKKDKKDESDKPNSEDKTDGAEDKKDAPADDKGDEKDTKSEDDKSEDKKDEDEEEDKKKKKTFSLEEYDELANKFSALESKYNALVSEKAGLEAQIASLTEFKRTIEHKEKEDMIASFYMLSDEDKKDVIDNIDNYSLYDIESKLSIICVRNKVSFNLDDDHGNNGPMVYNLNNHETETTPAWVQAVLDTAKNLH